MRKRKYTHATPRQFVEAWQLSDFVREVAKKVGSTKSACSRRATRYRRMEVPLKFMDGMNYHYPTDGDELATYARELAPEDSESEEEDDENASEASETPERGAGEDGDGTEAPDQQAATQPDTASVIDGNAGYWAALKPPSRDPETPQ
jgi:hypothetical protein